MDCSFSVFTGSTRQKTSLLAWMLFTWIILICHIDSIWLTPRIVGSTHLKHLKHSFTQSTFLLNFWNEMRWNETSCWSGCLDLPQYIIKDKRFSSLRKTKTSFLIQKLPHLPLPCCFQPAFLDICLTSQSIYLSSFTAVSDSLLPSSSASEKLWRQLSNAVQDKNTGLYL